MSNDIEMREKQDVAEVLETALECRELRWEDVRSTEVLLNSPRGTPSWLCADVSETS
jgi:hypothetical protein